MHSSGSYILIFLCEISNVRYEKGALDNWKREIFFTGLVHEQQLPGPVRLTWLKIFNIHDICLGHFRETTVRIGQA